MINVNVDDDDNDGGQGRHGETVIVSDKDDVNGVLCSDNDLYPLKLHGLEGCGPWGMFTLTYATDKLAIWTDSSKTVPIRSGDPISSLKDTWVWVEGLAPTTSPTDSSMDPLCGRARSLYHLSPQVKHN